MIATTGVACIYLVILYGSPLTRLDRELLNDKEKIARRCEGGYHRVNAASSSIVPDPRSCNRVLFR